MKTSAKFFNTLLLAGILVLLTLGGWRPQSPPAAPTTAFAQDICDKDRSVQVSGAAVVYVTPDRALLQLGVESNGRTPEGTQAANQQATQSVVNAVRALGVEARDIATDYFLVYPVYQDYNALEIKGYRIDNTVSITVRDVNLADDVLVAALRAGANQVQDVQFYTSQLRQYRDQARELAMKAAGEKAQALAQAAGAQAGCILSIDENTWSQYYGSWRGGRQLALWAQNTVQNAAPAQEGPSELGDTPVSLGQIAVRAEINASYSLK